MLWLFWASVTAFCTVGMDNFLKAVVIVHIRFARSLHADQMFQIAGSTNMHQNVEDDGIEMDEPRSVVSRPQSARSNKSGDKAASSRSEVKGIVSSRLSTNNPPSVHSNEQSAVSEGGAILAGLLTRRKEERAEFLS